MTVSAGWEGRTYNHNYISIEGTVFIDDEATSPYLVRTRETTVADNKLTMAMGIFDEYTMLNYLEIEAVTQPTPPVALFYVDSAQREAPFTVNFTDTSTNDPTGWQWDFDNNGNIDSTSRYPNHVYSAAGTYSVKLTVTNEDGSDKLLLENYISVTAPRAEGKGLPWLFLLMR